MEVSQAVLASPAFDNPKRALTVRVLPFLLGSKQTADLSGQDPQKAQGADRDEPLM